MPVLRLCLFLRIAVAILLPTLALSFALGQHSPPHWISAPLAFTLALSLAQCQGWRQLLTKNIAGAARQSAPGKSKREGGRREKNSGGNARKGTLAKCERQRRGSAKGGTGIVKRRLLALCSAPALSSTLGWLSPPPFAGTLLTLRQRSSCAMPALSPALRQRSTLHCDGALFCGAPSLYIGLCGPFMQVPGLFPSLHSSSPSFTGALPYAMPALG